jgi:hypothetical protein
MFRFVIPTFCFVLIIVAGCKKSILEPDPVEPQGRVTLVKDLPADTANSGKFTFFSLRDSSVVSNSDSATTKWDLGFRSTTIIINGGASGPGQAGAIVITGTDFDTLSTAPASGYATDSPTTRAIRGWYTYTGNSPTPPKHTVIPNPGTVIVLRTADGKYAKLEILSYYKGAPNPIPYNATTGTPTAPPRYYTFRYFYQPDGSRRLR